MEEKIDYDDIEVKMAVIDFYKKAYGIELFINPNKYGIDLLPADKSYGVEVERGDNDGDLWTDNGHSLCSGLGYWTLNVPQDRKAKYWKKIFYTKYPFCREYQNPTYDKNIFIRTNKDFTQFNLIKAETFLAHKYIFIRRIPKNSNKLEGFYCFAMEDVDDIWDLIDGKFVMRSKVENLLIK